MTLTAKEFSLPPEILKSARTTAIQHQGPFTLHFNMPGHNVPGAIDHGYGPLLDPREVSLRRLRIVLEL
jgi:hypothetical protein